jgi:hypothetical protein
MQAPTGTTLLVLPVAVLLAGQKYGPFVTPAVGGAFTSWLLTLTPGLAWPQSGIVLTELVEYSQDDGQTWRTLADVSWGGGTLKDFGGNLISLLTPWWRLATLGKLLPGQPGQVILATGLADLFRVTVNCVQSCAPLQLGIAGVP